MLVIKKVIHWDHPPHTADNTED